MNTQEKTLPTEQTGVRDMSWSDLMASIKEARKSGGSAGPDDAIYVEMKRRMSEITALAAAGPQHDCQPISGMELDSCYRCGSFEGATTTHCPGRQMGGEARDRVYQGEIDFRNGKWCNQPAIGMCHVYGTSRVPFEEISVP